MNIVSFGGGTNSKAVDAQMSLFDFTDQIGGCCYGMPCGCNDG